MIIVAINASTYAAAMAALDLCGTVLTDAFDIAAKLTERPAEEKEAKP